MSTATQAYHGNMSIADIAKEEESFRNLRLAQVRQQQKQNKQKQQQMAQPVNSALSKGQNNQQKNRDLADSGQMSAENKLQTDAQKKARLRSHQKSYKAKRVRSTREKLSRQKQSRAIKRYRSTPWILMYAAVAGNVIGSLFTVAIVGYLLVIPCTIFIDVMVWNALNKKDRREIRALMIMSSAIKFIPIVGTLPASLALVIITQKMAKKRYDGAVNKINKKKKTKKKKNMISKFAKKVATRGMG